VGGISNLVPQQSVLYNYNSNDSVFCSCCSCCWCS